MFEFNPLAPDHIPEIVAGFAAMGWNKPAEQYERYLAEQAEGSRSIIVTFEEKKFAGYLTILWSSRYSPFRDEGIPEISDLNVLPDHRRKGIGSMLIGEAEKTVRPLNSVIGIGVGMNADYGPAQRLYVKLGYVPDGKGIVSHGRFPKFGEQITVDDSLNMFFTKYLE